MTFSKNSASGTRRTIYKITYVSGTCVIIQIEKEEN